MTLKGWMLRKVNPGASPRERAGRAPTTGEPPEGPREPSLGPGSADGAPHRAPAYLGPYAPLVDAIREELERFAEDGLRLHLAIAERDRYLLTSVAVDCEGGDDDRDLLRRFAAEFKPEQIKRYLARELIAGLRNASAIDLSQFAGLDIAAAPASGAADEYAELLAELREGAGTRTRAYAVTLVGRWSPSDGLVPTAGLASPPRRHRAETPIAGPRVAIEVEDRAGVRRVELAAVAAGRRYSIGKDAGCDVVADGVYASRRHCEIWTEHGRWWVADTASTNGIRVESPDGGSHVARPSRRDDPVEWAPGTWLVLSADAHGDASHYPRMRLRTAPNDDESAGEPAKRGAPATPMAPPRTRAAPWTIEARTASGVRRIVVGEQPFPFGIGRSRNQALVVEGSHREVSGRHVEVLGADDAGASVVVHGDNGVTVAGVRREAGERFVWKAGETMLLGQGDDPTAACTLTLARG